MFVSSWRSSRVQLSSSVWTYTAAYNIIFLSPSSIGSLSLSLSSFTILFIYSNLVQKSHDATSMLVPERRTLLRLWRGPEEEEKRGWLWAILFRLIIRTVLFQYVRDLHAKSAKTLSLSLSFCSYLFTFLFFLFIQPCWIGPAAWTRPAQQSSPLLAHLDRSTILSLSVQKNRVTHPSVASCLLNT